MNLILVVCRVGSEHHIEIEQIAISSCCIIFLLWLILSSCSLTLLVGINTKEQIALTFIIIHSGSIFGRVVKHIFVTFEGHRFEDAIPLPVPNCLEKHLELAGPLLDLDVWMLAVFDDE